MSMESYLEFSAYNTPCKPNTTDLASPVASHIALRKRGCLTMGTKGFNLNGCVVKAHRYERFDPTSNFVDVPKKWNGGPNLRFNLSRMPKSLLLLPVVTALGFAIACGSSEPETIIQTVVVEREVEVKVIETVEVEKVVEIEKEVVREVEVIKEVEVEKSKSFERSK